MRLPLYEKCATLDYDTCINGVALSPDSKRLAAVGDRAHLYLVKITKSTLPLLFVLSSLSALTSLDGEYQKMDTLRYNDNDNGSAQGIVTVSVLHLFLFLTLPAACAWSADSRFVAVAAERPAGCYVFNISTKQIVYKHPSGEVYSSPDLKFVIN